MFKKIIIFISLAEILLIVYLTNKVITKYNIKHILGAVSVSTINKNSLKDTNESKLKYYYEQEPGSFEDKPVWLEKPVTIKINDDTLNNSKNYSFRKPENYYRIIALGDSYTYGDHVNTEDAWPEQLESMLNGSNPCPKIRKYEVLNLGMRGFDIQNSVERYRIRGQKYNPDLIIWFMVHNDFEEVRELIQKRVEELYETMKSEGNLDLTNPYDIPVKTATQEVMTKINKIDLEKMQDNFFSGLLQLYKGPLLIITFPFLEDKYNQQIDSWTAKRENIIHFKGLPDIYDGSSLILNDGHPNRKGHEEIAQTLMKFLQKSLIKCK